MKINKINIMIIFCLAIISLTIIGCTQNNPIPIAPQNPNNEATPQPNQQQNPNNGAAPSQEPQNQASPQNQPNQQYRRGNITDAQRQQMMARMQATIDECKGKTAGDSCLLQSPRGNITGTCRIQNNSRFNISSDKNTLLCQGQFNRGQRPGNNGGNGYQ